MRRGARRKTSFRLALAGLAAIVAGPALAQSCLQPAERVGFEVRLLQSQLQVAALQCRDVQGFANLEDQYRDFVRRFSSDFTVGARGLQAYFRRTEGNSHARALDSYITNLAQAQAMEGSRQGSMFCPLVAPLFRAALAVNGVNGLAELSNERNLLNTVAVQPCPPTPPAPARGTPARRPSGQRQASAG